MSPRASPRCNPLRRSWSRQAATVAVATSPALDAWNAESDSAQLTFLESRLQTDLELACKQAGQHPVFTFAALAGDCVLLHFLATHGHLRNGTQVVFVDTLHLFPETREFLTQMESKYGFTAVIATPEGCATKKEWNAKHSSDLYMTHPERYDALAKVEPLQKTLADLRCDVWINGRRRDHGAERAHLLVFEAGTPLKVNPLAHWTFAECWASIQRHGIPTHPLHADGYPSIGDVHSTLPVPREKWFDYGGERLGRFQGLTTSEGGQKTECGIHSRRV